ncbi:MAG: sigma-70 family RNA polymerase sigma factor [Bacteroidaceae bacterium]|nr:sigma-70 family RNA polymerase sigma factor [Bacteroidaceae bacterium]
MEKAEVQRLFKQYYARMYRVARTILYDEQESEDVVSDVFESLLYGKTVLIRETEERYLMTSVRNQCLKRLHHDEIRREAMEVLSYENMVGDVEDDRISDVLEVVVGSLSEQNERIFNLRFVDGCSYEEIAKSEGISKVAVWKHLSHLLKQIKNQLNTKDYDEVREQYL